MALYSHLNLSLDMDVMGRGHDLDSGDSLKPRNTPKGLVPESWDNQSFLKGTNKWFISSHCNLQLHLFVYLCPTHLLGILTILDPTLEEVLDFNYHRSYPGGKTWLRPASIEPLWWAGIRVLRSTSPKALVKFFPSNGLFVSCGLVVLRWALGVGVVKVEIVCVALCYTVCIWSSLLFQVLSISLCWC